MSTQAVPLVTLQTWRVPPAAVPAAFWRIAVDRRRLRRTPGVRFAKLLGTGRDRAFGPRTADLTRWVALIVWDSTDAAVAFDDGPVGQGWARLARATCRLTLRPLSSRGSWSGVEPFGDPATRPAEDRPVAVLTRARLRPSRLFAFWRAIHPVARALADAPGLLATFGAGEVPLAFQGTISVWHRAADVARFAYRQPEHAAVVTRTPAERWYAEELFARFTVLDISGDPGVIGWTAAI